MDATERAQQIAIERHRRIHNATVEQDEARIVDRYLVDISAYLADPALTEFAAMQEP